jgi:hypothetical protein
MRPFFVSCFYVLPKFVFIRLPSVVDESKSGRAEPFGYFAGAAVGSSISENSIRRETL